MSVNGSSFYGDVIALTTAVTWGLAVIFYRLSGQNLGALSLKSFQNIIATALFAITMVLLGLPFTLNLTSDEFLLVAISAVFGITLADTLYIVALNRIGAGYLAILDFCYSPAIILIAYFHLGETITWNEGLGAIFIVSSVVVVGAAQSRAQAAGSPTISKKQLLIGVAAAVISQVLMAVCVVMIKKILEREDVLTITLYRYLIGNIILMVFAVLMGRGFLLMKGFYYHPRWHITLIGTVIGPFLSTLLWFSGFKYTTAVRAALYNQLSSVFIFIFAILLLRETVSRDKIIAFSLALIGGLLVSI